MVIFWLVYVLLFPLTLQDTFDLHPCTSACLGARPIRWTAPVSIL